VHDIVDPVAAARGGASLARGESVVIATPLDGDSSACFTETGARYGTLGDAARTTRQRRSRQTSWPVSRIAPIENGGVTRQYFFDRQSPPTTVVIVGAGQIAMSLTRMARELDMRTIVVDGRERYATRERFPDADEIRVGMPSEIVASIAPSKRVAVVLIAHDYKYELPVLRAL
jgi:xanthine dehydrogenase accessory factor